MLSKKYRLSSKEFPNVYKNGKKIKGEYGMLVSIPSTLPYPQFGFVVSKKIGNAVKRHKMTRRLRNICMELMKEGKVRNMKYQYIAFKYADEYGLLKEDFSGELLSFIKGK